MTAVSKCMRLHAARTKLVAEQRPVPTPQPGQLLLRLRACGVCRTDLHVVDGDLPFLGSPLVPGHEIVGEVVGQGEGASVPLGTRLGVPWLGYTCGQCEFCLRGEENLCDRARFTGYNMDGDYAEHVVADARYCFELPPGIDDTTAHIVAQVARWHGQQTYAFTRPGDTSAQQFASQLGACWTGGSDQMPPVQLDAAIIFAPVGALVPLAMRTLRKGGTLVCGGIHMSDVPSMPYSLLWGERSIRSVANLTRRDGVEFLSLAARIPIDTRVTTFALSDANDALTRLRGGALTGAAVLLP